MRTIQGYGVEVGVAGTVGEALGVVAGVAGTDVAVTGTVVGATLAPVVKVTGRP